MQTPQPKATRSTLQNRRLNQAIRATQLDIHPGMRTVSRRAQLPRAGRSDFALATAGGLLIFLLVMLTIFGGHLA